MNNPEYVVLGICLFIMALAVVLFFKNENTYKNLTIISNAIYSYNVDLIKHGRSDALISYSFMASYTTTWLRLWDWGYKHIVPPEIFEVIKPYTEE